MGLGPSRKDSPAHPVILTKGFYLGKFEVTREEYHELMLDGKLSNKGQNLPVVGVSWNMAMEFCMALNRKEKLARGWEFSLPTEAEWEYACRAGSTTAYSWGDKFDSDLANSGEKGGARVAVGSYPPNSWGFYDLHGNLLEWTSDWYAPYSSGSVIDPKGPASGSSRVHRGGSWTNSGSDLRSAWRVPHKPSYLAENLGFRIALKQVD